MGTKQRGLTLIELMVTLAVAIILVAVGMPLFSGVVANNRAVAQTNALVTALNLARSEAVARGTTVSVVATGGDWTQGWTVFADQNANGAMDAGEGLRVFEALSDDAVVAGVAGATVVVFDATGASDARHDFDLDHTDAAVPVGRCVSVNVTGNISTKRERSGVAWSCP